MSTWHIFCVCQVDKVAVLERFVNFLELRKAEVELGRTPLPRTPVNKVHRRKSVGEQSYPLPVKRRARPSNNKDATKSEDAIATVLIIILVVDGGPAPSCPSDSKLMYLG